MKRKLLLITAGIIFIVGLIIGLVANTSIGIIGGADGPTAIYVTD